MSLDVTILNDDGSPGPTVSIGVGLHARLFACAKAEEFRLLARLANYYGDAAIDATEASRFAEELDRLLGLSSADEEVSRLVNALRSLTASAIAGGRGLDAIAD
jgi:hypothetical protein